MRFLLAAAGTAGHVEPALAVAAELRARGHEVWILGTDQGTETSLVPARGFPLLTIDKVTLPRRVNATALSFPFALWRAVAEVKRHLRRHRIDVVLGFGGYAAGAAYAAARLNRVSFVVFSYDAKPGFANRWAARWTPWHAVATPTSAAGFSNAQVTGVPLRDGIRNFNRGQLAPRAYANFGLDPRRRTVVVFGGSLGAARINSAILACYLQLREAGWQVLHINGARDVTSLEKSQALQEQGGWTCRDYVGEMHEAYAIADLVVSRAGAMTCAELTATGIPGVLIPYAVGNGEQQLNAQPLIDSGGWVLLLDRDADGSGLWNCLQDILEPSTLANMTTCARGWSERMRSDDAAFRLATLVEQAGS